MFHQKFAKTPSDYERNEIDLLKSQYNGRHHRLQYLIRVIEELQLILTPLQDEFFATKNENKLLRQQLKAITDSPSNVAPQAQADIAQSVPTTPNRVGKHVLVVNGVELDNLPEFLSELNSWASLEWQNTQATYPYTFPADIVDLLGSQKLREVMDAWEKIFHAQNMVIHGLQTEIGAYQNVLKIAKAENLSIGQEIQREIDGKEMFIALEQSIGFSQPFHVIQNPANQVPESESYLDYLSFPSAVQNSEFAQQWQNPYPRV